MSQLDKWKAAKPRPEYKLRRLCREVADRVRAEAEFQHDINVAYLAMFERIQAQNVERCVYAPRASPAVH